jgi:hypothetical protein
MSLAYGCLLLGFRVRCFHGILNFLVHDGVVDPTPRGTGFESALSNESPTGRPKGPSVLAVGSPKRRTLRCAPSKQTGVWNGSHA